MSLWTCWSDAEGSISSRRPSLPLLRYSSVTLLTSGNAGSYSASLAALAAPAASAWKEYALPSPPAMLTGTRYLPLASASPLPAGSPPARIVTVDPGAATPPTRQPAPTSAGSSIVVLGSSSST